MPEEWKMEPIKPIPKQEDQTTCKPYTGIKQNVAHEMIRCHSRTKADTCKHLRVPLPLICKL